MLIVHDFAYSYGGAERVTEAFADAFPEARVAAIGGRRDVLERMGVVERAETILPAGRFEQSYRALSPFLPRLLRRRSADVVLSSSYAFAHHVRASSLHVEYCHTPMRQLWVAYDEYQAALRPLMAAGLRASAERLRREDRRAVAEVDVMIASCENVRSRIEAVYGREAHVMYPPVSDVFLPADVPREPDLALIVARLVEPYKAVRPVLEAFAELPYRLVVAGDGRDAASLQAAASPNVRFVGQLSDVELRLWYSRAQALVFPGEDDFGIVPLEAMACGTPVVALDSGGARETVLDGTSGVRFAPGELGPALRHAMSYDWDRAVIREHATGFSRSRFVERIREVVDGALGASAAQNGAAAGAASASGARSARRSVSA